MVYSILMLILQQYATTNKECTKHVTSDKQLLLTITYYFQHFHCHFFKYCNFCTCSIPMLMLQQHAATNKQWINCILFRIIIENIFLTINSSFIEIFLRKTVIFSICSIFTQMQLHCAATNEKSWGKS